MKQQSFHKTAWVLLSVISLACYLYLTSIDPAEVAPEYAGETVQQQEDSRVSLPEIALLKKVYDLAQAFLRRQG